MKAVFDTRSDTAYDDDIVRRYHFPNTYIGEARKSVGDWIVYREPRRGAGRQAYVAVARVTRVESDPTREGHSYAYVEGYLPFDVVVPFRVDDAYAERWLNEIERRSVGRALQRKSIRTILDSEFVAIVCAGLAETLDPGSPHGLAHVDDGDDSSRQPFGDVPLERQARRIVELLTHRPFRDKAFRRSVMDAYEERCAVTGLRIVNGRGRVEAQAAHIWPVDAGGPDIVQNGIALSATCHWLFDRHLISLSDEYALLVSHNRVPDELRRLFATQEERIHLPRDERLWPRREYVAWHRERFAGG